MIRIIISWGLYWNPLSPNEMNGNFHIAPPYYLLGIVVFRA